MKRRLLRPALLGLALLAFAAPAVAPLGSLPAPGTPVREALPLPPATDDAFTPPTPGDLGAAAPPMTPTLEDGTRRAPDPAVAPGPDPQGNFLRGLLALEDPTPTELGALVRAYYAQIGLAAPPEGDGAFDQNVTVSFSYHLGDVTGDGTDDVALDQYCASFDGCVPPVPSLGQPVDYANWLIQGQICGLAHRVLAISGADGAEVWANRLDRPRMLVDPGVAASRYISCAQEFVVGTVPLEAERHGLLVYRLVILRPYLQDVAYRFEHEYYLLDPLDGHKLWSYGEDKDGVLVVDAFVTGTVHAENILLNPILQVPPRTGVSLLPASTQPALLVQSVGFDFVYARAPTTVPGMIGPYPVIDAYWPNEWAARIDLGTGAEVWNVPTFTRDTERSVLPAAVTGRLPFDQATRSRQALWKGEWYWAQLPCCFDSTGDGVPDLLYWTREWSTTPATNNAGDYMLSSNVVLFDGASGQRLYTQVFERDTPKERWECELLGLPFCLMVYPQMLGDATGDGKADYILHAEYYDYDYRHRISVRNGPDGATLWEKQTVRNLDVLVLGDATGDGGNDFALFEWHNSGFWFTGARGYGASNVTSTPVVLHQGSDGAVVWRAESFQAPVDLLTLFSTYRLNGVPDLDGDGVGDLPLDDPVHYPDLTIVHRLRFLSGRTAQPLFELVAVGAFAFPALAGDLDGDGEHDLALINGDVNDLWITAVDGSAGQALWSRRVMALRETNYYSALVKFRTHPLSFNATVADALLINVHFEVTTFSGFTTVSSNTPQLAAYLGRSGDSRWSIPVLPEADVHAVVPGATPLSQAFLDAYQEAKPGPAYSIASHAPVARAALGAGLFLAFALAGYATTQWRRSR